MDNETKAIIYSTPTCPYCDMAKAYLQKKGVEYVEYDVSSNREKAIEMITKTKQKGVPVIEVNRVLIIGFDTNKIDAVLEGRVMDKEKTKGNIIFDNVN